MSEWVSVTAHAGTLINQRTSSDGRNCNAAPTRPTPAPRDARTPFTDAHRRSPTLQLFNSSLKMLLAFYFPLLVLVQGQPFFNEKVGLLDSFTSFIVACCLKFFRKFYELCFYVCAWIMYYANLHFSYIIYLTFNKINQFKNLLNKIYKKFSRQFWKYF